MTQSLVQYYRCPEDSVSLAVAGPLANKSGYFRFGEDTLYGRCCGALPAASAQDALRDLLPDAFVENGTVHLPFDLSEVVENLRCEKYAEDWRRGSAKSALASLYYLLRPALPVGVRKWIQRTYLQGWNRLPFPRWPVDRTVENVLERALMLSLQSRNEEPIPFLWFWPDAASGCVLMTHDVETAAGRDQCPALMDMNDAFGIKASFQVIPEERYSVRPEFLNSLRRRGFEVVIHDLNHDGHLFRDRAQFEQRAAKINAYGREYGASGFRAGVLYRNQLWYDALDFQYDMSVPNVAHLDPQRGGCCTVMPYFIGEVLELPVTTTQDYTLFHILNDYSIALWKRQSELILEKHGLVSFVIHPDYIRSSQETNTYRDLLAYLAELRETQNVWVATPGEVNRWWRQRAEMRIIEVDGELRIEGQGQERASIAYASAKDGRLLISHAVPENKTLSHPR